MEKIDTHYSNLFKHKIDALFNQGPVAISMGTIAAFIIFIAYINTSISIQIGFWLTVYLIVYAVRYVVFNRCRMLPARERNYRFMHRFYITSSIIVGLLWSGMGVYILYTLDSLETLYFLLVLGGLISGAVATNVILMSAFHSFTLPASVPLILFLLGSNTPQYFFSGWVLLVFMIFITFCGSRLNKLVTESLYFQFENLELLGKLEQEKNQVTKLYSDLEIDLEKRKEAEELLKLEKEKAEEMAQSLLAISTLDGLTGIHNRRHFDSILAKEWNRAGRSNTPISLIMCDIDFFKSYNDHYGHQMGDKCLIQIADILKEHARRDDDLAARYGGEEFTIILPTTNLENAKDIAEQMRVAILDAAIKHRYSETENIVTASFGVAMVIPQREQLSNNLVSRADKALYMAKKDGRNRVVAFSPQIVSEAEEMDSASSA